jgi:Cys-tRNA(Pro)/Cys-tRNA(Cys) deacylase
VDREDPSAVRVVFNTLVCRGDRTGVCLAVVPADRALDLEALARAG